MRTLARIAALALAAPSILSANDDDGPNFGAAGLLSGKNKEELPPIIMSMGEPIAPEGPWVL